jgi:hypothetical protein
MTSSNFAQTAIKNGFYWLMSSENISLQSKKEAFIFLHGDENVTFMLVVIVDGQVLIKIVTVLIVSTKKSTKRLGNN